MARFDGTGPLGKGPMTGRNFGPCEPKAGLGRRFCSFRGMGRRFFGGWNNPQSKMGQTGSLEDYKKALEEELKLIKEEEKKQNKSE